MESTRAADNRLTPDAAEFVRFCHRRRTVGWPELYDEMCAVASRGLFRGWGPTELAQHGIGFGLFELPALAELTGRIVEEEQAERRAVTVPRRVAAPAAETRITAAEAAIATDGAPTEEGARPRLVPLAS